MGSNSTSQLSAATALAQLLAEYPELPTAEWRIGSIIPTLEAFLFGDMSELAAYAEVLGGSVRAAESTYTLYDREMRRHVLTTVWRDVPVEVSVALPVAAAAVSA
ncbi:hypothetical protein [Streptomyces sp. NPDC016845]|uniref:hypothetical protein n=1 Tax=Streptomyces sp. NPDC016845 TaxID=3364972 RepID=UPI0037B9249F